MEVNDSRSHENDNGSWKNTSNMNYCLEASLHSVVVLADDD
jgi:hypothetical protein